MYNIQILDENAAKKWEDGVRSLNNETKDLLELVGNALIAVQEGASSDVVDDIAKWGNNILENATKVFDGMNVLADAVSGVMKIAQKILDTGKNIVAGFVSAFNPNS